MKPKLNVTICYDNDGGNQTQKIVRNYSPAHLTPMDKLSPQQRSPRQASPQPLRVAPEVLPQGHCHSGNQACHICDTLKRKAFEHSQSMKNSNVEVNRSVVVNQINTNEIQEIKRREAELQKKAIDFEKELQKSKVQNETLKQEIKKISSNNEVENQTLKFKIKELQSAVDNHILESSRRKGYELVHT